MTVGIFHDDDGSLITMIKWGIYGNERVALVSDERCLIRLSIIHMKVRYIWSISIFLAWRIGNVWHFWSSCLWLRGRIVYAQCSDWMNFPYFLRVSWENLPLLRNNSTIRSSRTFGGMVCDLWAYVGGQAPLLRHFQLLHPIKCSLPSKFAYWFVKPV